MKVASLFMTLIAQGPCGPGGPNPPCCSQPGGCGGGPPPPPGLDIDTYVYLAFAFSLLFGAYQIKKMINKGLLS